MRGTGASPGIVIGKAVVNWRDEIDIVKRSVDDADLEIERLNSAIEIAGQEIEDLYASIRQNEDGEELGDLAAHGLTLKDPEFRGQIESRILTEGLNAEWAVKQVSDDFIQMFEEIDREDLKSRADDVKDVTDRIIKLLLHVENTDISSLTEDSIIVSRDLTTFDAAHMDRKRTLGIITELGGRTSHPAIMARILGIPAVVGLSGIMDQVEAGDIIVLDGEEGMVYVNPDDDILEFFEKRKNRYDTFREKFSTMFGRSTVTRDGFPVQLLANVGVPADVNNVLKNDGEGIGLFRTESLYMGRDRMPTEEEQFDAYARVARRMAGRPVIIRTLDIGGDKGLSYLNLPEESNPFLGYRAIRLCLDRVDLFRTQLRALLRASIYGDVKVVFPMISCLEELRQAKAILEGVREDFRERKVPFNEEMEIGMIVETPSAAVLSDHFAREVDFFSIGTNDLLQYSSAVDRGNENLSALCSNFHPALLRFVKLIIDNGHSAGIRVGICGEMAGEAKLIPVLLAMGLDNLSVNPSSILRTRWIIDNITMADAEELAGRTFELSSDKEIESACSKALAHLDLL